MTEGEKNRDAGIQAAITHAVQVDPQWKEKALECVREYPKQKFMAEEVRFWAHSGGLSFPQHSRAWGAVFIEAREKGLIVHAGYGHTSDPRSHKTPASIWRKVA